MQNNLDDISDDPSGFKEFLKKRQQQLIEQQARAISNDSSLKNAKEKITKELLKNKNQVRSLSKEILNQIIKTDEEILKLPALALLLKHLENQGLNTQNCFISHDPILKNTEKNPLPELYRLASYALKTNEDINILHKFEKGHIVLIHWKGHEQHYNKSFFIIDSLGTAGKYHEQIVNCLQQVILDSDLNISIPIIYGREQRQHDLTNCTIFAYKDLKAILKTPQILEKMEKESLETKETGIKIFSKFPATMMKLAQKKAILNIQNDERSNTIIETKQGEMSLLDYIKKSKKLVYTIQDEEIEFITPKITYQTPKEASNRFEKNIPAEIYDNFLSDYYHLKYIHNTYSKLISDLTIDGFINCMDTYDGNLLMSQSQSTGEALTNTDNFEV